jgi:superfamily I DNA and/or RNA helicase
LKEKNRINVALTRAKHGLIMVGNKEALKINDKWRTCIETFEKDGVVVEGYEKAV